MIEYRQLPLAGRTALVTGAASGIGAAIAKRAADDGAQLVYAVDKNLRGAKETAEYHPAITAWHCDLNDLEHVDDLPAEVHVLVNVAGFLELAPIEDSDPDVFDTALRVMLTAPYRLMRIALPYMYAAGWGRIINVSSVHEHVAAPYKSAYVAAKHGLAGLMKVAALEAAQHGVSLDGGTVTCVNIAPTHVSGPLLDRQLQDEAPLHGRSEQDHLCRTILAQPAIPRLLTPDEVAEWAAVCYGPASASLTGTTLGIDGGWTAR